MSGETLLIILIVGLIAGWLASIIVKGTGSGLIGDICIGIVGALIGSWALPRLGIHPGRSIHVGHFVHRRNRPRDYCGDAGRDCPFAGDQADACAGVTGSAACVPSPSRFRARR